ncbi:MAG: hypothetical protein A3B23_04005 [Candidatus Colwellbacteria bacterium RIFCSPLOWO2_01_FULL_48_10]|uniref:Prepilin-type N-terminal cleavage/methylation domain-containing protein n=1 Tax=Candidatus Colwellbacteria bacterium RIFCSPLOWO2_01_FULL_48_10 TaxID=1797690 RepID=A0A1G1Z6E2_9BACT|nr:MAG: hypothetical protein A3B23_04005 [Candidatus Colwellbacteria bacterium RIFCSPLOWO2_01_FULL_48_10]
MENFKFQISNFKLREGFTMGELIVGMSLFLVVISLASGTFIQGVRSQRNVVTSTSVTSNVTQTLERIAREIRTARDFNNSTASTLAFTNARNEKVSYTLLPDNSIGRCIGPITSCVYTKLTADKVKISRLKFAYSGIGEPDLLPPRITISLGVIGIKDTEINLQTTVAAREIGG